MKTEIKYLELSIDAIKKNSNMFKICKEIAEFIPNDKVRKSFIETTSEGIVMNDAYIDLTNQRIQYLKNFD